MTTTHEPTTVARSSELPVTAIVALARYPIAELEAPAGRRLVAECRRRFDDDGLCLLPGFLTQTAVAAMTAEIRPVLPRTYYCHNTHNAYLTDDDPTLAPDHPRRRQLRTDVGSIAYDHLPADGALCRLYRWDPLTRFIGALLGHETFHRSADPIGALSVNVFEPGGGHAWHFDDSRFTVTAMLQPAQDGGHFEYVPGLRTPDDEGHTGVGRVLNGDRGAVQRLVFEPGTLSIFGGRHTLHRVTTVGGTRHRLVPVLCYDTEPGARNSDEVRLLFWGRTEPEAAQ